MIANSHRQSYLCDASVRNPRGALSLSLSHTLSVSCDASAIPPSHLWLRRYIEFYPRISTRQHPMRARAPRLTLVAHEPNTFIVTLTGQLLTVLI